MTTKSKGWASATRLGAWQKILATPATRWEGDWQKADKISAKPVGPGGAYRNFRRVTGPRRARPVVLMPALCGKFASYGKWFRLE
jgi:hypothetical protein